MANINPTEAYQEALSLALEDRSEGYQDLVSNSNVLLYEIKDRGGWETFSGPKIRERLLFAESGTYIRYKGFDFLNPMPADLFNDDHRRQRRRDPALWQYLSPEERALWQN